MLKVFKDFLKEEDGMGVVEIIIIIAVLVAIALFFRRQIFEFVGKIVEKAFPSDIEKTLDSTPVRNGSGGANP